MERDKAVFDIIKKEEDRQRFGIELIASENFVSEQVMQAMGSVMTNKYAEGYPGKRYYGGCQFVDETEQLAIDRAKELFGAEYANVQPHSGAQANMAVFLACLKPGDKFLGLDLSHGGHLSHGSAVNSSGILYNPIAYGVDEETGTVNYDKMEEIALKEKPKLILAGASAYSRDWDFERMRDIADQIGAILMADMEAHLADYHLVKVERASMAHSLEVRVPLLDLDAVELDIDCIRAVDQTMINKHRVLPLVKRGQRLFPFAGDHVIR